MAKPTYFRRSKRRPVAGLKRGHQNRTTLATDLGRFLVTLSASSAVQGHPVTVTAQYATSGGTPSPTAGLVITWNKAGSGGSFSTATSTTDANGRAMVTFTAGLTVGTIYTITATAPGPITGISTSLTVTADLTPASITLSPAVMTLAAGTRAVIVATVKNVLGTTLVGVQPTAWQTSESTVASVNATGLVTGLADGSTTITATLSGLTSSAATVVVSTVVVDDETVFRDGTDTARFSEDFSGFASAHAMYLDKDLAGVRFGQTDFGEDATGVLLLTPGRDGVTGKRIRFVYAGDTFDESHEIVLRNMDAVASTAPGVTHVFQYWARVLMSSPLPLTGTEGELPIKWFMMWHPDSGPNAGLRCQHNTHNHLPYPTAPRGAIWQVYDTAETAGQANQPVGPYPADVFNAGQWVRYTHVYRANSSVGARDGFTRMYIGSTKVIDISLATVGVTPDGGYKTWCEYDDLDALGHDGLGYLKIMGNLTHTCPAFTVDWTEFAWWTRP